MNNRMMTYSLREYIKSRMYLAIFIFGLVVGTVAINILSESYHEKIIVTGEYYSEMMSYIQIDKGAVFLNGIGKYMKEFVIVLFLNFFFIGRIYNFIYLGIKGLGVGVVLSSYVLSYGIKGLFLYIVSTFPHYILYIPAIVVIIGSGISIRNIVLENASRNESYGIRGYSFGDFIRVGKRVVIYFVAALLLSVLISLVEAYINVPVFRKSIYNA